MGRQVDGKKGGGCGGAGGEGRRGGARFGLAGAFEGAGRANRLRFQPFFV